MAAVDDLDVEGSGECGDAGDQQLVEGGTRRSAADLNGQSCRCSLRVIPIDLQRTHRQSGFHGATGVEDVAGDGTGAGQQAALNVVGRSIREGEIATVEHGPAGGLGLLRQCVTSELEFAALNLDDAAVMEVNCNCARASPGGLDQHAGVVK